MAVMYIPLALALEKIQDSRKKGVLGWEREGRTLSLPLPKPKPQPKQFKKLKYQCHMNFGAIQLCR